MRRVLEGESVVGDSAFGPVLVTLVEVSSDRFIPLVTTGVLLVLLWLWLWLVSFVILSFSFLLLTSARENSLADEEVWVDVIGE